MSRSLHGEVGNTSLSRLKVASSIPLPLRAFLPKSFFCTSLRKLPRPKSTPQTSKFQKIKKHTPRFFYELHFLFWVHGVLKFLREIMGGGHKIEIMEIMVIHFCIFSNFVYYLMRFFQLKLLYWIYKSSYETIIINNHF